MTFKEILNFRRSVRVFDPDKDIDPKKIKLCLQQSILAPNSSNMQLWEFYHITDKKKLEQLSAACFDQPAAKTAKQMVVFVVRRDLWKKRTQANLNFIQGSIKKNSKAELSEKEKFTLKYYKKLIPFIYARTPAIIGQLKYLLFWITGFFRPVYRQVRKSDVRIIAHKSVGLAAQTFMLSMAEIGYDTCPMEGFDSLMIKKILDLPGKAEINMVVSCGIRLPEGVYGERFRIPFDEVYSNV
jgi:nitroreductase